VLTDRKSGSGRNGEMNLFDWVVYAKQGNPSQSFLLSRPNTDY
jgi:hypothetical protein